MIPKIIHYCWLSGDPLPEYLKGCINTWRKIMPDYEIKCWDMKRFDIRSVKFVEQACSVKKWAFAADYIRLYALYNEGGIYLDSDVLVFKRFDKFLYNAAFASIESYSYKSKPGEKFDYSIDGAMIGAEKGNRFIGDCLRWYDNKDFILTDGSYNEKIIGYILAEIGEKKYGFKWGVFSEHPLKLDGNVMTLYPPYVFSHIWGEIRFETCAIHMLEGGWKKDADHRYRYLFFRRIFVCLFGEKWLGLAKYYLRKIMNRPLLISNI